MRRTFILFFVAVGIVAIGLFFFLLNSSQSDIESGADGGRGGLGSLFPFNFGGGDTGGSVVTPDDEDAIDTRPVPTLRRVSDTPASGGVFFTMEQEESDSEESALKIGIRYVERATGHVFETQTDTLTVERISNSTIPRIQEVLWENENSFIIRYIEDNQEVKTFYATLATVDGEQSLNGAFLGSWNRAVLDHSRENLFSVEETARGLTARLSKPDGSKERVVYTSPIGSWIPLQSDTNLFLQTAPSPEVEGYLYRVAGRELTPIVGGVPGMLSVVSGDGKYVLVSGNDAQGNVESFVFDVEKNERLSLPLSTIATKCSFVGLGPNVVCGVPGDFPNGDFPNDWLLGSVSFSDDIWLLNPIQGSAQLLSIPEDDADTSLDVTQPTISEDGLYFGFVDKNNLSFWALQISE